MEAFLALQQMHKQMQRRGKGPAKKNDPHLQEDRNEETVAVQGAVKAPDVPAADESPKKQKRYQVVKVKRNYVNRNSMDMFNS